jgi:hypothetical protein
VSVGSLSDLKVGHAGGLHVLVSKSQAVAVAQPTAQSFIIGQAARACIVPAGVVVHKARVHGASHAIRALAGIEATIGYPRDVARVIAFDTSIQVAGIRWL